MSLYEILQHGASVEYGNAEAGAVSMQRFTSNFPKQVWLNPKPHNLWQCRHSIELIRQLVGHRMYALTIDGLEHAMRALSK